jgi:hypothetical protein
MEGKRFVNALTKLPLKCANIDEPPDKNARLKRVCFPPPPSTPIYVLIFWGRKNKSSYF